MASPCEVLCETEEAAVANHISEHAAAEALRIEQKYSRYRDDSVISQINTAHGRPLSLDEETARLVDYGATLWRLSEGRFDLTSGVLRYAWRFDASQPPPTRAAVTELMKRVGWQHVDWKHPRLTMPDGMEIDLGGIGKEYAVDRVAEWISGQHAVPCLVNFGGDLRCVGPPPASGTWQVGIESTTQAGQAAGPDESLPIRAG